MPDISNPCASPSGSAPGIFLARAENRNGARRRRTDNQMGTWLFQRYVAAADMVIETSADCVEGIVFALDVAAGSSANFNSGQRRVIASQIDKLIFGLYGPSRVELVLQAAANRVSRCSSGIFGR